VVGEQAVEHRRHAVAAAADRLVEPLGGERREPVDEAAKPGIERVEGGAPGLGGGLGRRRPALVVGDAGGALAVEPLAHDLLPGGDVEHQLPDRVGARHRARRRHLGGHPGEQLAERRTVPGGALDRPAEQVGEALDLVHRGTPFRGGSVR
jgi:hypothetical protein